MTVTAYPTGTQLMTDTAALPADYLDRVYAGTLGKVLGVYLGRPFEGWSHERIAAELGDIDYYVHDKVGVPLIVADDDISGTFTFLRALPDHGNSPDLTSAQVGDTWLNYLVENRTVLWWGGLGVSTEHTAYLRLADGMPAPASGSIAVNGQVVAEQIGAQIFIDGWAMVAPGRPDLAADLAYRAGTVSHDGESVYAAQLLAAMEAQAFVTDDIDALIDTGLTVIPADSLIATMIADVRRWHTEEPDWRAARDLLDRDYGYHRYGGGCHVIPNHGLIILALLYGGGDWDHSMMIVNTCGWDTDCNSGNLGCLLGIRNGMAAFDKQDWRGPVADRIIMPTADGGRTVTDVAREALAVANAGRALAGLDPVSPKHGARFHFSFPGSVQGFTVRSGQGTMEAAASEVPDERGLTITLAGTTDISTPTFLAPEDFRTPGYELLASPTLYPGQQVRARVLANPANAEPVTARLVFSHYAADDAERQVTGEPVTIPAGSDHLLTLTIPAVGGQPVNSIGLRFEGADGDRVLLDTLDWSGEPDVTLDRPAESGQMWRRAWVDAVDHFSPRSAHPFDLTQDRGRGLAICGTRDWRDYTVSSTVAPHLADVAGLAVRVQGLRRYYAVLLSKTGTARLVKVVDGSEQELAGIPIDWVLDHTYDVSVTVTGTPEAGVHLHATVDGEPLYASDAPITDGTGIDGGGIGFVVEAGHIYGGAVTVGPAS
jgi:ADP-ribosylglycohydrolase